MGETPGRRTPRARLVGSLLLAVSVTLSVPLFSTPGTFDVTLPRYGFLTWMDEAVRFGVLDGYSYNPYDYPPGTKVLLGAAGMIGDAVGVQRPTSFKGLLFFFHALTSIVTYAATRNLLLTGLVHSATLMTTIGLGYLDILYTPWLVLSLISLQRGRNVTAWGLLCLACTVKPQPLILTPFYLVHLGRIGSIHDLVTRLKERRLWLVGGVTLGAALLIVLAFGRTRSGDWAVLQAVQKATAHNEISGNAMNAGWIGSYVYQAVHDGERGAARLRDITWTREIKTVAVIILGAVLWLQIRRPKTPRTACLALLAGYLAYFTFNAGVHENHVFIAMLLAVLLLAGVESAALPPPIRGDQRTVLHAAGMSAPAQDTLDGPGRATMIGVILFAHVNLFLFYGWNGDTRPPVLIGGANGLDLSVLLAPASIVLFLSTVRCLVRARVPTHEAPPTGRPLEAVSV